MSETRDNSLRQQKKHDHKTVFPSDFFTDVRISDPKQKQQYHKLTLNKANKLTKLVEVSPKKSVFSDSTSAISKENEHDEYFKLPKIGQRINEVGGLMFPFRPTPNGKNSQRRYHQTEIKGAKIVANYSKGCLALPPKKLFKESRMISSTKNTPRKLNPVYNRASMGDLNTGSPVLDCSLNKSPSHIKNLKLSHFKKDGYGTDDYKLLSQRKYSSAFKSHKPTRTPENLEKYSTLTPLPIYESDSDENSIILEKNIDDVFEKLCELADENTPLPDIYQNNKQMEATFHFNKDKVDSKECISFEKLVDQEVQRQQKCPSTVMHQSDKANGLKMTAFRLSRENPEYAAMTTAYFGSISR